MIKYSFTTVINQEGKYYISNCLELNVVSQGESIEEAMSNLREAVELYLEDIPKEELREYLHNKPMVSTLDFEYA